VQLPPAFNFNCVQLKVVCFLTHDELKPLFRVCKALHATVRPPLLMALLAWSCLASNC
jgi:hypothetical protein